MHLLSGAAVPLLPPVLLVLDRTTECSSLYHADLETSGLLEHPNETDNSGPLRRGRSAVADMKLDVKVGQQSYDKNRMSAKTRLDLQRALFARSERVKGIDFHPTEPWVSIPSPE